MTAWVHPFETAGLGTAPFVCVGMTDCGQGASREVSCDYCGTGIRYKFHIKGVDGSLFSVGCDCVSKTSLKGDELRKQVARLRSEHRKSVKAADRKAQREAWEAEREMNARKARTTWLALDESRVALTDFINKKAEADQKSFAERCGYTSGDCSFFVSLDSAYKRFGYLTEKQEAAVRKIIDSIEARKNATFVGSIGERRIFNLTVKRLFANESDFGMFYTIICEDEDGNTVLYKGSKRLAREGDKFSCKATVKDHSTYRDTKQTIIARPAMI
jgi:hypothetical protein